MNRFPVSWYVQIEKKKKIFHSFPSNIKQLTYLGPLQTTPPPLQHLPAAPHQTFFDNRQQLPPHQQFPQQQQQLSTGAQPQQVLVRISLRKVSNLSCVSPIP